MRALVLVLVCGCKGVPLGATAAAATAAPHVAGVPEPVVFAIPDEIMEFRVTLRGVHVGLVQTAIGKPGWVDGRRAIIVKSRGKTDGFAALIGDLVWELTTTIDLDRSLPIDDHEEAWAELAGEKNHQNETQTWDADDHGHDLHSAVGALRGWRAVPGQHTTVRVAVGGGHFPIDIWDAGAEPAAGRPAVRYDGIARDELHFSMWVSDDLARVPLAFQTESKLGTIAVELTDYQVPKD